MRRLTFLGLLFLLSCSSMGFQDHVYVLDVPNHNLRAHDPKDDQAVSQCDPKMLPSGKLQYQCVAHFMADYQLLLNHIVELETQLKACQGKSGVE